MRDLAAKRNVAVVLDTNAEAVHTIYYRLPTTEERLAYRSAFLERKGDDIVVQEDVFAVNRDFGLKVITGFKTGSFGVDGKLISSDPKDKNLFREDWKELLSSAAPDIVVAVTQAAFGVGRVVGHNERVEASLGAKEGEGDPLSA